MRTYVTYCSNCAAIPLSVRSKCGRIPDSTIFEQHQLEYVIDHISCEWHWAVLYCTVLYCTVSYHSDSTCFGDT